MAWGWGAGGTGRLGGVSLDDINIKATDLRGCLNEAELDKIREL